MARALAYSWTGRADPSMAATLDAGTRAQFALLGLRIPASEVQLASAAVEVWDVNWPAFRVFLGCATQWRVVVAPGVAMHLGLDYPGVEVAMARLAPPEVDRAALFADVQAMEAAALPILNEATR